MSSGYLYCFSNEFMPGIYKIGMTERTPEERLKDANSSTFVLYPFQIEFYKQTDDVYQKEQYIHRKLETCRINKNKEFFKVDLNVVREIFNSLNQIKNTEPIKRFDNESIINYITKILNIEPTLEIVDYVANEKEFSTKLRMSSVMVSSELKKTEKSIIERFPKKKSTTDIDWFIKDMIRMKFEKLLRVPQFKGVEKKYFNDEKREVIYEDEVLRALYTIKINDKEDLDLKKYTPKYTRDFFNKESATYTEVFKAYVGYMKQTYGKELYDYKEKGKFFKTVDGVKIEIPDLTLNFGKLSNLVSLGFLYKSNDSDIDFDSMNIDRLKYFCKIIPEEYQNIMFADYWRLNTLRESRGWEQYKTFKDIGEMLENI